MSLVNVPLRKWGIMKFICKKICFDINSFETRIEHGINCITVNQSLKMAEITPSNYIF